MKTDLVPVTDLKTMADAFSQSGLFGTKTSTQCMALLLLAQAEGVHPAIAMRDFDVINGRPAKKAEAMHRSFLAGGGSIEWHKLDDTCADATFKHPQGGEARITWDMERVKKAKISNEAMYTKYPRQMLRSRCISEGCRTVFPSATSGLYEPGEVRGMEPKDMGAAEVVEEPFNWGAALESCASLAMLKSIWDQIPELERPNWKDIKDKRKVYLTTPAATPEPVPAQ